MKLLRGGLKDGALPSPAADTPWDADGEATPMSSSARRPPCWRLLRQALYWALPPALLAVILSRIDLPRLGTLVLDADLILVVLGLMLSLLIAGAGAMRWHLLARNLTTPPMRPAQTALVYWKSLAIGAITPGSVGCDAYRVTSIAKQTHRWLPATGAVVVEKLAALVACLLLLGVTLPLSPPHVLRPWLADSALQRAGIAVAMLVMTMLMLWHSRQRWWPWVSTQLPARLARVPRAATELGVDQLRTAGPAEDRSSAIRSGLLSTRRAVMVVALSVGLFAVSALQAQLFFRAIGQDVSLMANLTVAPLLFLVFSLPISFGTIGVREGSFVLLYGAFGVPPEPALLVSFFGLVGLIGNYLIGALLHWSRN